MEGVNYFLEARRITRTDYFNTFTALLGMPDAAPLRAQLADSEDKLLALLGAPPQQQQGEKSAAAEGEKSAAEAGKGSAEGEQPAPAATATGEWASLVVQMCCAAQASVVM